MKKILSLVLAALMVFSMVPAIFAEEVADTTAAVEEVSEYQAAIDFLKLLGIYVGTSEESFVAAAKEPVNRAQMALFTSRFITGQVDPAYWMTSENDSGFTDVDDLYEEAIGAISFASQKGIVNGVGEGLFDPETGVQYREAITMIVRALGYTYKASGYPWSYINKARELGLLDGIANIGYTEQINREVVAQLLYNALFVEQDGTNVAESVFNVGATVVMITATNAVTYADKDTVLRNDFVRFQELDAQGEPTGAQYHVAAKDFGLDAAKYEDDAAVGTLYAIIYKNGCADILEYASLNTVYENRGAETNFYKDGYLTVGGTKLQIVTQYNDLFKDKNWNGDKTGSAQVKLYKSTGKLTTSGAYNGKYIIAADNVIYELVEGVATVYAKYSPVMGKYYLIKDGSYKLLSDKDLETLFATAGSTTGAFATVTDKSSSKMAYADFITSDANQDGVADRAIVKQYSFGQISFGKKKDTDKVEYPTFTLKTNDAAGTDNSFNKIVVDNQFKKAYRWTGLDVSSNAYVIYYFDADNKEIDILHVVDADAADGTYTVKGYLRGYDATKNVITLGADATPYTIGYNILNGAPIKANKISKDNDNLIANVNLVQSKINTYVELVIVDNKVVYINSVGEQANYVIIDSIVSFEEDGVVVNAYSTVTDDYRPIKVAELNGWTVGGFDYTVLYLTGILGGKNFEDLIPVKTKTLYQVVYNTEDVYNLTAPVAAPKAGSLTVNTYGYIENTDGKAYVPGKYTASDAADYWLIMDNDGDVVSFQGKLHPVVTVAGNIYKTADKDYVVLVEEIDNILGLTNLSGLSTKFMMYNADIYNINNSLLFIQNSAYQWSLFMQDVVTGANEVVYINPALVKEYEKINNKPFDGKKLADIGFEAGAIYCVACDADGKLVLNKTVGNTVDLAYVADYYADNGTYGELKTEIVAGGTTTANIFTKVAEAYVADYFPKWTDAATKAAYVATYAKKENITVISIVDGKLAFNNDAAMADTTKNYTVYYVYTAAGKALAFVDAGEVVRGAMALTSATKGGVADAVVATKAPVLTWAETANDVAVTVDWSKAAAPFESTTATYKVFANIDCSWGSNNTVDITATAAINTNVTVDLYDAINDQFYGATDVVVNYITVKVLRDGKADIVFTYEF